MHLEVSEFSHLYTARVWQAYKLFCKCLRPAVMISVLSSTSSDRVQDFFTFFSVDVQR